MIAERDRQRTDGPVSFHPRIFICSKIVVTVVNLISHKDVYKRQQLICTSHSTNLLDLDLLRRDQIWFTEKGEQTAATDLFSLYDFSVRKDMKVEKGYLIGRFGAIPFIKGNLQNSTRTATQKMKTCDTEAP